MPEDKRKEREVLALSFFQKCRSRIEMQQRMPEEQTFYFLKVSNEKISNKDPIRKKIQ